MKGVILCNNREVKSLFGQIFVQNQVDDGSKIQLRLEVSHFFFQLTFGWLSLINDGLLFQDVNCSGFPFMSSELKICNAQNEKNGLQVTIYFLVKRIVKYRPNISKLQVQRYMKCLLMSHSSNVLWHNFFSQKDCMICFDEKRQSIFRPHFH